MRRPAPGGATVDRDRPESGPEHDDGSSLRAYGLPRPSHPAAAAETAAAGAMPGLTPRLPDPFRRVMDRLEALRVEQRRSGKPMVTCGYCSGDTRFDVDGRFVACECCGAYMLIDTTGEPGRAWQVL